MAGDMGLNLWALSGVVLVAVLTFVLGIFGSRSAKTTPDFLVARRAVPAHYNATAIAGEYLSAASFLGVASLVLKDGADALWYSLGFAAGYLALMLFVAAPLRRSGAYTLPDFAEARLGSVELRHLATLFLVLIGLLYIVPQFQVAGLTLATITGLPSWTGSALVAVIVVINVLSGGMRATTLVQAAQFWVKLFAIAVPAFVLSVVFLGDHSTPYRPLSAQRTPNFITQTKVVVQTPVRLHVDEPVQLEAHGRVDGHSANGVVYWSGGTHIVAKDTTLIFPTGAAVPVVDDAEARNAAWLRPEDGGAHDVVKTYSLMFATFLGTMGLPHVLVRFYTNPDGRAARRTALHVLLLLGVFYLFPTIFGALSRLYIPQLLVTGTTDAAVLLLPSAMLNNPLGTVLSAVTAAGAFAAFLATSAGLVVCVAGVLATDVLSGRVRDFRLATAIVVALPLGIALGVNTMDVSQAVVLAFAMAASTFCPLLVLGIWWRGLTAPGAAAGLLVGGGLALASSLINVFSADRTWMSPVLSQPAVVSVPAAFLTMVVVSKATRRYLPPDVSRILLRLHAPDPLGFVQDRDVQRFGSAEEKRDTLEHSHGKHRK